MKSPRDIAAHPYVLSILVQAIPVFVTSASPNLFTPADDAGSIVPFLRYLIFSIPFSLIAGWIIGRKKVKRLRQIPMCLIPLLGLIIFARMAYGSISTEGLYALFVLFATQAPTAMLGGALGAYFSYSRPLTAQ